MELFFYFLIWLLVLLIDPVIECVHWDFVIFWLPHSSTPEGHGVPRNPVFWQRPLPALREGRIHTNGIICSQVLDLCHLVPVPQSMRVYIPSKYVLSYHPIWCNCGCFYDSDKSVIFFFFSESSCFLIQWHFVAMSFTGELFIILKYIFLNY